MKSGEDWLPWEELVKQEEESVCVMVRSGEEWLPWEDLVKQEEEEEERESVCV